MKSPKLILIIMALMSLSILAAKGWDIDSDILVNLTQSQFSDNWAGSELSNITWTATSNTVAQKQVKEWLNNKNSLKLAFGQTHMQKRDAAGNLEWDKPQKSTDQIAYESLLQFTLKSFVDPYVSLRMDSQFLDQQTGQDTYIVNPIVFTESAGIMRSILNTDKSKLNVRVGGAVRETWNRRNDKLPIDGGVEGIVEYKQIISAMNASYNSKLTAYQALFKSDKVEGFDNWKALDVKWENMLSFKLWKLLSMNLNLDLIYEKEQSPDIQWREVLGLGFSYVLF
ncbi:MAG: DUF3078 domain-containing protein [Candidatus Cloacimonadaceae bacterium]|nr:DUF3078 domain-containing protein [Candidatus Cloacimonadota bacterium]MDX9949449.1 DUF3078 domain-containing protein [Candidatus Syntrophosphaera sp.]